MRVSPDPATNSPPDRRTFQGAQTGRSHRDHAPAFSLGLSDGVHCGLRNGVALTVHDMLFDIFGPHRFEGSCPDMQCHIGDIHPFIA